MNEPGEGEDGRRAGPDGSAWPKAQRLVAERNDQARKAAKQRRQAYERQLAAKRRAARG